MVLMDYKKSIPSAKHCGKVADRHCDVLLWKFISFQVCVLSNKILYQWRIISEVVNSSISVACPVKLSVSGCYSSFPSADLVTVTRLWNTGRSSLLSRETVQSTESSLKSACHTAVWASASEEKCACMLELIRLLYKLFESNFSIPCIRWMSKML